MLRLIHSEWFRLRHRAIPWVLAGVFVTIIALFYLLMWFVLRSGGTTGGEITVNELRDQLRIGNVPDSGLQRVEQFGAVFVVILASSLVATEFTWGTIRTLLPRSRGRVQFLSAKMVIVLLFAIVLVLLGFAVSLAVSALVSWGEGLNSHVADTFWTDSIAGLGRVLFVMVPYTTLAIMVTMLTRSSAAGIGVTLGVMIMEPVLMAVLSAAGGPLTHLPEAFLSRNVTAFLDFTTTRERGGGVFAGAGVALPGAWQAGGVLLAYSLAFVSATYWSFVTRDIHVS
jgi:ABC-2 type transport system permease protein